MPLLLYTYLITESLAPFFASLLILTAILFLGRLIPLFDFIINFGIGPADFIRLCAFMVPNIFLFAIPMASMLGVILCFTRMGNDNELIALKATGTGLYRMLPAVIIFALCTSLLTGYFSTTLIPAGSLAMKKLFFQLAKEKIDKGLRQKQFSEGLPGIVVYIEKEDEKQGTWKGVYVSDTRDNDNPVTIIAESGFLTADMSQMLISLQLDHGSMHAAKDTHSETVSFASYALHIPLQGADTIGEQESKKLGKNEMTQSAIQKYVADNDPKSPKAVSLLVEYHMRLVLAVGCFILTILGLPLAIRTKPGQRSIGAPLGLLIFISYYVVLSFVKGVSETSSLPVMFAMWTPNLLFGILTIYILRFASRESTLSIIDFLLNTIDRIQSLLPRPRKKDNS
ncbi:MAG: LPS export ABC transporter permease LptF [Pseudomonadota bacterium]